MMVSFSCKLRKFVLKYFFPELQLLEISIVLYNFQLNIFLLFCYTTLFFLKQRGQSDIAQTAHFKLYI